MRVMLVDDHALFRAGLASLLRAWGLDIVGEADNGRDAVQRATELSPDLVFMDINMPGLNGLEATRAIKTQLPETKVIMLTVSDDEQHLFEAIKSGAEGYLLKNLREEEFAELVRRLEKGEPIMSPGLARRILQEFAHLSTGKEQPEAESALTQREQEVLEQVARGSGNREIAAVLLISENTVNFHMKNILSKLHLKNRSQVVIWALEHGFAGRAAKPPA
ncbi:MAG: response regulator transcription factor [Chloroflexi bacterium]|nr:response regulator transcription factor [Chloroflexota bacterium]